MSAKTLLCRKCRSSLVGFRCPQCWPEYRRALNRRRSAQMADNYIRGLMSSKTGISRRLWTGEQVELKRATLAAKRIAWQKT